MANNSAIVEYADNKTFSELIDELEEIKEYNDKLEEENKDLKSDIEELKELIDKLDDQVEELKNIAR